VSSCGHAVGIAKVQGSPRWSTADSNRDPWTAAVSCGFVEKINVSWEWAAKHLDEVRKCVPLRTVVLTTEPEWLSNGKYTGQVDYFFGLLGRNECFAYSFLALDTDDIGLPNQATQGDPWRRHVARRLLAATWPGIRWILPVEDV
jgi:hypothetical protein